MSRATSNNLVMVKILDYMREYSNIDNPMQVLEITDALFDEYGIHRDRKTVGAALCELLEEGYIENLGRKKGYYFSNRPFDDGELRMLIHSVLGNHTIPPTLADELVRKIEELGGDCFSGSSYAVSVADSKREENVEVFDTEDTIFEAIRNRKMIAYDYYKYGVDGKLYKTSSHQVSPYDVIMNNQRLYLQGYSEERGGIFYHRLDRMKNVRVIPEKRVPLKDVPGYNESYNLKDIANNLPYMYADEPEFVTFSADADIVDQIMDWFGEGAIIGPDRNDDTKISVAVRTSPRAMEYWAKQYLDKVEIIASKTDIRGRIYESLEKGLEKYKPKEKAEPKDKNKANSKSDSKGKANSKSNPKDKTKNKKK